MKLTFLGTGTSHGVPVIGCDCTVCRSTDARNIRTRSSLLVTDGTVRLVIDTGPDLRTQMLRSGTKSIDAVFLTHDHADHLNGIDDLRVFTWKRPLPFYGAGEVLDEIRNRFRYIFSGEVPGGGKPRLELHPTSAEAVAVGSLQIMPVPIRHGCCLISGYRIGKAAYLTDCSGIPEASYTLLEGLDTVIIGALRHRPHPTHFSINEAVEAAGRIGAKRSFLTHFCHDVDHAELLETLPAGVYPAHDGLVVEIPD